MSNFYVFDNNQVGALVFPINQLGNNIKGAEVGVLSAQVSCCFLQKCNNIDTMYLIDPYKEHFDSIQEKHFDEKEMEIMKLNAHHNVKWSGFESKAKFLEMTDDEALNEIDDESLDFVYIDVWLEIEQIVSRIEKWSKKVRPGGIVSGHDWYYPPMQEILEFYRNDQPLYNVNNVWMWYKD